jgi:hypothetical protein
MIVNKGKGMLRVLAQVLSERERAYAPGGVGDMVAMVTAAVRLALVRPLARVHSTIVSHETSIDWLICFT